MAQHLGLEAGNVSAIAFDHRGFMWLGSQDGLYLYNGHKLQKFEPDVRNPGAIAALDIRNLYVSRDLQVWVATNSGGLSRFNAQTHSFQTLRHDSTRLDSLSNDSVYDVVDGPAGDLWIATQKGLNRLDHGSGKIQRYLHTGDDDGSLPSNYVYRLFVDHQQRLWVATLGGGLAYWGGEQQGFIRLALPQGITDIFALAEQDGGVLWVGTRQGLLQVQLDTLKVQRVSLAAAQATPDMMVISLAVEADNVLVGTYGHGLWRYDATRKRGQKSPLPQAHQTITSIVKNSAGQYFYSTWGQGVYPLDTAWLQEDGGAASFQLNVPNVNAIVVAGNRQRVWLGSFSDGLYGFDLHDRTLHKHEASFQGEQLNGVLSLAAISDDELLVGTSSGLWRLGADGQVHEYLRYSSQQAQSIGRGFVRVLAPDRQGNVWIGIGGEGLYRYQLTTGQLSAYRHDPADPSSLSDDYISALLLDEQAGDEQVLWVGTRSNGLNRCQLPRMVCQRVLVGDSGLRHFNISDIAQDQQGTVWIGTDGGGLHRVRSLAARSDRNSDNRSVQIEPVTPFPMKSIKAILPQTDGSLWVSTPDGLYQMLDSTDKFRKIRDITSTSLGGYNQRSRAALPDYSVFGRSNGVFFVAQQAPLEPVARFPLRITEIAADALASPLYGTAITDPFALSLPWGEPFRVEFALLDYQGSEHSYEYRLSASDSWISLNTAQQLNFSKMEPGQHTLEVRGKGANDLWSEPARLQINVVPPWWRNPLYLTIIVLVIVISSLCYHHYRMAKWRKITSRLHVLQGEKERVIQQLEHNETQLKEALAGMRRLASAIQQAKEDERKSISRELHDEFGQTLTATQIGLQLHCRQFPQHSGQLASCINTVKQMIQQIRTFAFHLRPSLLDDVGLVAAVSHQLQQMTDALQIPIRFSADPHFPELDGELSIAIFRVIQELVTNAIKHANASLIDVALRYDGQIIVMVNDNGVGFDLQKIRTKVTTGGHLGLLGIEERVLAQQGQLEITTAPQQGVSIRIQFAYEH